MVGGRFHIYRGSYVVHLALKVIVVGTVVGSHLGHCWHLIHGVSGRHGPEFDLFFCFVFFLTYLFFYLLFYFWLCWVFVSVRGLSPVVASGGHSSSRCAGLPLSRPLLLQSTGSRRAGSAVVAHGPSCSAARGILPDQGSNPCPLHWQADSQPLHHQGSPDLFFEERIIYLFRQGQFFFLAFILEFSLLVLMFLHIIDK